jgi:hypothetical protein
MILGLYPELRTSLLPDGKPWQAAFSVNSTVSAGTRNCVKVLAKSSSEG